jgi:DNA-binding transcriptional LysR family regulator
VNIPQLKAFVAVVDACSFSGAARALGLSQPAVTMQIQGLEADLGATLLDRGYRNTVPTEAGAALLPHARAILAELGAARAQLDALGDMIGGHLVIAASTTPGQYVLPRLLGRFLGRYPEVGVTLNVLDSAAVSGAVESGAAAVGVAGAQIRGGRAGQEAMGTDEIVVIAAPGHPAVDVSAPEDLAGQRWVMREEGSGTRMVAERALNAAGIVASDLDVVLELGTNEAIVNAVEGGLGIAPVSRWAAERAIELGTLVTVPVAGFPARRPFFLVTPHGSMPRAAQAFAEYLKEELA